MCLYGVGGCFAGNETTQKVAFLLLLLFFVQLYFKISYLCRNTHVECYLVHSGNIIHLYCFPFLMPSHLGRPLTGDLSVWTGGLLPVSTHTDIFMHFM